MAANSSCSSWSSRSAWPRPASRRSDFDYRVRDDMFRAFGGNEAAFKSAMAAIDETLSANPDHAEALVWRGVGGFFQAGRARR